MPERETQAEEEGNQGFGNRVDVGEPPPGISPMVVFELAVAVVKTTFGTVTVQVE